ncbi:MAG: response regulator transcription factor [Saprospiraceae bacterium]
MIRIIIADDHTMFRQGLISLLKEEKAVEVVGEAANGKEVMTLLERQSADLLLLDIEMPEMDGFDVLRALRIYPNIKVLVLTMHTSAEYVKNLIKAGADGYLQKDAEKSTLMEAISKTTIEGSYYTSEIATLLLNDLKNKSSSASISPREKEVIQLIVDGNTTKEIANKLFLSKHTVESHRQNILLKLQLKNSPELVKYAIQNGLV